jgi:ferritin-like metal-binding protein YciE
LLKKESSNILNEEKAADQKLSEVAMEAINVEAAHQEA